MTEAEHPPSTTKTRYAWISRLLAAAVGLLLLTACLMKAVDMPLFMGQIKAYGIIADPLLITCIAWGMVTLQWILGFGLLIAFRPGWTFPLTALLWAFLMGVTGWAWVTGVTQECGCYGAWITQKPGAATLENLVFLLITLLAWKFRSGGETSRTKMKSRAMAIAFILGLALPLLSGVPTTFKGSSSVWDLPEDLFTDIRFTGTEQIDLKEGTYLLFLMAVDCLHCQDVLPQVDDLADEKSLPRIIALTRNSPGEREAFIRDFDPAFPVGQCDEEFFWGLLGAADLPRFFLIRDGRVLKVWDRKAPAVADVREALTRPALP